MVNNKLITYVNLVKTQFIRIVRKIKNIWLETEETYHRYHQW